MSDDFDRLEELFQAAADLDPAAREAYLNQQCADDPELKRRAEMLLGHLDDDQTLAKPIVSVLPQHRQTTEGESEAPGSQIGRYKLLEVLGEGGFGVVYLAEQQAPVVRQVALKVIKLGMDTREVVARFEAERQALALMDHPNIAKVLDGGATDSGRRPFFVMELVRGVSITDYCQQQSCSTQQRLELFISVCQAVQHAHQKGIIHRDLKPTNVLVTLHDGEPVPMVIDFGIAKAMHTRLTEKTLFTEHHRFIGTPAYMSPEQAETTALDIDTRTDIYSLGVLLYELLTGSTPFSTADLMKAGLVEIQRILREDRPQRPSQRLASTSGSSDRRQSWPLSQEDPSQLRGDLDWIVMKAMEKERQRRYGTASDLAADLGRHLRNEPVQAGPPSRSYRLGKFLRRHRAAVLTVGLALLALIVGSIGTGIGLVEASRQRDAAEREAQHAEVVTDFLTFTLSLSDPEVALNPDVSVRTMLDRASAQVTADLEGQPRAEARIRGTIGRAYESLGEHALAEQHLRRAVALIETLPDYDPRARYDTLWTLTHTLFALERPDSFVIAQQARAVAHQVIRQGQPALADALDELIQGIRNAAHEPSPEPMRGVVHSFERAAALARATLSDDDPLWPLIADSFLDSSYSLWYSAHEASSQAFLEEALAIQRRALGPGHPATGETIALLVGVLSRNGRPEAAEEEIRQALISLEDVLAADSFQIAFARSMLGMNLLSQDHFAEAEPLLLDSHRVILDSVADPTTFYAVDSYSRMISLYQAWDRPQMAVPYQNALARLGAIAKWPFGWPFARQVYGPDHSSTLAVLQRFEELCGSSFSFARPGTVETVGPLLQDLSQALREESSGAHHQVLTARLLVGWSHALVDPAERRTMVELALPYLQQADDLLDQGHLDAERAEALLTLAAIPAKNPNAPPAPNWQQAVRLVPEPPKEGDHWILANTKVRIAQTLTQLAAYPEAETLLVPALHSLARQFGDTNPDYQQARQQLHDLYRAWGKPEQAARYAQQP